LELRMPEKKYPCPHCGKPIAEADLISAWAAIIGAKGRGAAKRRDVDYSALARKAHAARARNKAAKA